MIGNIKYHPVSQTGKNFIRFSIFSKVENVFENAYWSNLFDPEHWYKKVDIDPNIFFFKRFDFETDELGFYFYHIYKLFLCVPFLTTGAAVIKQIILCPSKSNVITSI